MAVRVRRAHLGADHAVRGVPQFVDIGRFNGLGEAGPAASRIQICRTRRTAARRTQYRRRCPVPCYPDILRFRGPRCRFAALRDTAPARAFEIASSSLLNFRISFSSRVGRLWKEHRVQAALQQDVDRPDRCVPHASAAMAVGSLKQKMAPPVKVDQVSRTSQTQLH